MVGEEQRGREVKHKIRQKGIKKRGSGRQHLLTLQRMRNVLKYCISNLTIFDLKIVIGVVLKRLAEKKVIIVPLFR